MLSLCRAPTAIYELKPRFKAVWAGSILYGNLVFDVLDEVFIDQRRPLSVKLIGFDLASGLILYPQDLDSSI